MVNITYFSSHRDLKIYINDLLHLHLLRDKYVMLQTYYQGDTFRIFYIDIHTTGGVMTLEYEEENTWESIVKALNTLI